MIINIKKDLLYLNNKYVDCMSNLLQYFNSLVNLLIKINYLKNIQIN